MESKINDISINERATLAEDLRRAEDELAGMRAEITDFESRSHPETLRLQGVTNPRWSNLLYAVGGAESRVEALRDDIARLDKVDAYQRRVAESITHAREARAVMTVAERCVAELGNQVVRLREKISIIETETRSAEAKAVSDEAGTARAYAQALASGDTAAEKGALEQLKKAQAAVIAGKVKGNTIGVLVNEAERLEEQAQTTGIEAEEQRRKMCEEITFYLQGRWNGAAKSLADIGARGL
jgi:hypothetical protein